MTILIPFHLINITAEMHRIRWDANKMSQLLFSYPDKNTIISQDRIHES